MKRRLRTAGLVVGAALLIAAAAGWWYLSSHPEVWQQILGQLPLPVSEGGPLTASGFIEAEEVDVAPELGGRLIELSVEEGDDVEVGARLVRFDETLLQAQIEAAQAEVGVAEAELAQVRASVPSARIRQAEAAVAQAEITRDGAYQAWQDAVAIRDHPQDLDAQIVRARAQVEAAEAAVAGAEALKDAAAIAHENFLETQEEIADAKERWSEIPEPQRPPKPDFGLQLGFHMIPYEYQKAGVNLNTAKARLKGARRTLQDLYEMRSNPQDLDAQIDEAKSRYEQAQAGVDRAQAHLEGLRAGASEEQIATLEARVVQARSRVDTLLRQRDKLTITAPVGGLVLDLAIHKGELAPPGSTLLTLGMLDQVTLTAYVPETRLGDVQVGQAVEVRVDSFPDRTFEGEVVAIASEHEFTPRNVQTEEERVHMVFGVDIRIPNPDHALKPGVPADATFTGATSSGKGE